MRWLRHHTYLDSMVARLTDARRYRRQSGFTLLEVMIAVSIFSFALLGFSTLQVMAIRFNASAYATTQIASIAQEQMETLLALPFNATWLRARVLQDTNPSVGQGTTYCILYPDAGLQPCLDSDYTPPGGYCVVRTQSLGGSECSDTALPPPAFGAKARWSVDIDFPNQAIQLVHILLTVSRRKEGRDEPQTFTLSFARSSL